MRAKTTVTYSFTVVLLLILILSIIPGVLAITASLGNSKMVLRLAPGDKIQKSILVKNTNDEKVNIELFVSGDLEKNIELERTSFSLEAGEEQKAYFLIKAPNEIGTKESRINIKFVPKEGSGVGLSATVVVVTSNSGDTTQSEEHDFNPVTSVEEETNTNSNNSTNSSGFSFNQRAPTTGNAVNPLSNFKLSGLSIMLISTIILVIVLIVLIIYFFKTKNKSEKMSDNTIKAKRRVKRNE